MTINKKILGAYVNLCRHVLQARHDTDLCAKLALANFEGSLKQIGMFNEYREIANDELRGFLSHQTIKSRHKRRPKGML